MQRDTPTLEFMELPIEIITHIVNMTILIDFNCALSLSLTSKTLHEIVQSESNRFLKNLFEAVELAVNKKSIRQPNRCVFFKSSQLEINRLTSFVADQTAAKSQERMDFQSLLLLRQQNQRGVEASESLKKKLASITRFPTPPALPEELYPLIEALVNSRNYEALDHFCLIILESFSSKITIANVREHIYHLALKTYNEIEFAHLLFHVPFSIDQQFNFENKALLDKAIDAKNVRLIQFLLDSGVKLTNFFKQAMCNGYIEWLVGARQYTALEKMHGVLASNYDEHINTSHLIDEIYSRAVKIYNEDELNTLFSILPIDINKQVRYEHVFPTIDLYSEYYRAPLLHLAISYANPGAVVCLIKKGANVYQSTNDDKTTAMLIENLLDRKKYLQQPLSPWSSLNTREEQDQKLNDIQLILNALENYFPAILVESLEVVTPDDVYIPTCMLS